MKYIKTNEEFLGGLLNFFKGLFKKYAAEMQKLNDDPNKIKEYIINNMLNPKSANSIFKKEIDDFRAKKVDTDEACFAFLDNILNKDTGILGKQGIGLLFNDKSLQGDKMKVKRISFEYILTTARDQISKKLKYDQTKNIERTDKGFSDMNYLPAFKDFLLKNVKSYSPAQASKESIIYGFLEFLNEATTDAASTGTPATSGTPQTNSGDAPNGTTPANTGVAPAPANPKENEPKPTETPTNTNESVKNIESVIKWVETNIAGDMINTVKAIKEDDIKEAVTKGGVSAGADYKAGEVVKYKMDGFVEGTPEENQPDKVGKKAIEKVQNGVFTFKKEDGSIFTKTAEQIIGKESDGGVIAPKAASITSKLAALKAKDPTKLDKVDQVLAKFDTPEGEQQIDSILGK